AAEQDVRAAEAGRQELQQSPRKRAPHAHQARILRAEPEPLLADLARRATDLEEREVRSLLENSQRADQLAREASRPARAGGRRQVVDPDAQASPLAEAVAARLAARPRVAGAEGRARPRRDRRPRMGAELRLAAVAVAHPGLADQRVGLGALLDPDPLAL